jgi:hypothetical protein
MSMATTPATLPKSGAVSKGYNFAYAWEKVGILLQVPPLPPSPRCSGAINGLVDLIRGPRVSISLLQNAPLTEQQNAAISALSHAVAERPFPANLVRRRISHLLLMLRVTG